MDDETYEGWTNWDTWETALILDNTESTYRWMQAWKQNFKKKIAKGTFNMSMAEEVVRKYLIPVARGTAQKGRFPGLTPDPLINPKKVNKREIVEHIIHYGE